MLYEVITQIRLVRQSRLSAIIRDRNCRSGKEAVDIREGRPYFSG